MLEQMASPWTVNTKFPTLISASVGSYPEWKGLQLNSVFMSQLRNCNMHMVASRRLDLLTKYSLPYLLLCCASGLHSPVNLIRLTSNLIRNSLFR